MMENHRSSGVGSSKRVKRSKSIEMLPHRISERPYEDKSLDIRERLKLWRAEKRKCEIKGTKKSVERQRSIPLSSASRSINRTKNDTRGKDTNLDTRKCEIKDPSKALGRGLGIKKSVERQRSMPLSSASRSVNKKTPSKDFLSPSKRDTYKDTNLDMRERLELWMKEKGKTPQTPRLSKRVGITPKTPCLTPNQRRKTWASLRDNEQKLNTTGGKTKCTNSSKHGILKARTAQKTRKSSSVLWCATENMAGGELQACNSPVENSSSVGDDLVVQDEDFLRHSITKCNQMLDEGCKQEEVVFTLDDLQRDYPNILRHALYWICRAKLAEQDGDHERVVCMYEQASAFSAQPEQAIKDAFSDYKSRKEQDEQKENKSPILNATFRTPHKTPSRELAGLDGEVFASSVVRFCLLDSTPFRKRNSTSEKHVLTPVRRTTRWERCGITHPKTIEEKQVTVASLDELSTQIRSGLVFRPNSLLPCELDKEMQCIQDIDEF